MPITMHERVDGAARSAGDTSQPLSAGDFEAYLSEVREIVLAEIVRMMPRGRHTGRLYDLMLEYPLRHGKSLRPALCLAACRAFGGTLSEGIRTAAVIELYHNAFLIHDDVEDGSTHRRSEETLHQKYGVPIAINVGDGILALSLQPLLDNTRLLGLGRALRILETVAAMSRESAEGQMLELDWAASGSEEPGAPDYVRMVYKKTCWYSFIAPLETGAIAAGIDAMRVFQLRKFATVLGIAFQIVDDVLNVDASAHEYGKEPYGDLWEGKRTLLMIHALERATPTERAHAVEVLAKQRPKGTELERLDAVLRECGLGDQQIATIRDALHSTERYRTAADVEFLQRLIRRYDGAGYARAYAERYCIAAQRRFVLLCSMMPSSVHRDFIASVVDFVVSRRK